MFFLAGLTPGIRSSQEGFAARPIDVPLSKKEVMVINRHVKSGGLPKWKIDQKLRGVS